MPQEFDSVYRVIGFGDRAKRMALYDIPRDDVVWVNTIGYDDEINAGLEQVESGNIVEAAVTDDGDDNEYWNLTAFEIQQDTRLYFVTTDGYSPGPVDDFWETKDANETLITAGRDKTDEEQANSEDEHKYWYELQLQQQEVPDERSDEDELIDVYESLQYGELLTEPLFAGNGCEYLDEEAEAVIVVNPKEKDYIAMYIFPTKNAKYNEIWGSLYEYVEDSSE